MKARKLFGIKARTEGGGLAQCLRDVGGFKVG